MDLQQILQQMQSRQDYAGDDDYPQYQLPTFIYSERAFQGLQGETTPNKERAFTIANKATPAMEYGNFEDAKKMAYHALSLDPLCIDAWRVLCKILNQTCDGDTVICATREVINFSRQFFKEVFEQEDGMFYSISYTRPYMRLLSDIAYTALQSDQLDVAIYSYEEMIRLNHNDNIGARDCLLCCYLKIIGRIHCFPGTKPIRTIDQAQRLINCKFGDDPLFESDNLTVRWANLCFAYLQKKNWKQIAKKEYEKNDLIFKVIFNDIEISKIPPASPDMPQGFVVGSKSDDVRAKGGHIKEAMKDWPNLVIDLSKLLKGKASPHFMDEVKSTAPNPPGELTSQYKQQMTTIGNQFLDQGRSTLSKRDFTQSVQNFTLAKRGFYEAAQPSRRWYLHAPFAIASNRATASYHLRMWNLLRIDTRFTITMKPDHEVSYLRLPKIAEAFQAKQLYDDFKRIVEIVQNKEMIDLDDWKNLAKTAIGLTSITAIAFAAEGKLTQELKDKLIQIGIEDSYTPVNYGLQHSILPWLKETDLERPIPNQ